jgi:transposase-like protein
MPVKLRVDPENFARLFPDEEAARRYFSARRWPRRITCPRCASAEVFEHGPAWTYDCRACRSVFSLTARTALAATKLNIRPWLEAVVLFEEARLVPPEVARRLGISAQTAGQMRDRIEEAMLADNERRPKAGLAVERFLAYAVAHRARQRPRLAGAVTRDRTALDLEPIRPARFARAEPLSPAELRLADLAAAFQALADGRPR